MSEEREVIPGTDFTLSLGKVLSEAYVEAGRLRHAVVDTDHLMLGFIAAEDDLEYKGERIFEVINTDPKKLKTAIEILKLRSQAGICGVPVGYTDNVKACISLARILAKREQAPSVNERHLFLALLASQSLVIGTLEVIGTNVLEAVDKLKK